tara:strand:+ start:701 stop:934 length:234 start_codon:yes stop_codon:yes gene_type:complete
MRYKFEDIEKILEFKTWTDKNKIDELLRIDCSLYANLGSDSTKTDKETVKKKSRIIYKLIKTIDSVMGESFLYAMDT